LIIGQQRYHKLGNHLGLYRDFFAEALNPSVMRVELGGAGKRRRSLREMHGLDLEERDDETGQTFDASEMPGKMQFEHVREHERMIHGVISSNMGLVGGFVIALPP
jgi:hypothetical protein